MARLNIKYDLTKSLGDKLINGVGTSKHKDKQLTQKERAEKSKELKEQGLKGKEYQRALDDINKMENKIYMDSTFKDYKKICDRFSDYVIEQAGTRRITIEESKQYIQGYINKLIEEEKTPSYQKKQLAAICKATGAKMRDYYHQEVSYAKQTERKLEQQSIHKNYNERVHRDILDLNKCIGIRRSELKDLEVKNITIYKDRIEIYCPLAKGGKNNINVVRDTRKMEVIEHYYNKAIYENRDKLVTSEMINNDADLHRSRAQNARDEYYRVIEDIEKNNITINQVIKELNNEMYFKIEGIKKFSIYDE